MEYVEGEQILRYCDSRGLAIPERLRLFQAVCSAVQYAHRNLVVHRDIKPANILVDAEGSPKLLDFGIAKLLNPELLAEAPTATAMVFTPEYASPEQASGGRITAHRPPPVPAGEPPAPRRPPRHRGAGAGAILGRSLWG